MPSLVAVGYYLNHSQTSQAGNPITMTQINAGASASTTLSVPLITIITTIVPITAIIMVFLLLHKEAIETPVS